MACGKPGCRAVLVLAWLAALCGVRRAAIDNGFTFSWSALYPEGFWCPELGLSQLDPKVDITGTKDASAALVTLDDPALGTGILFMEDGTYLIAKSITLANKPIYAQKGAIFNIAKGVTLNLNSPVSHPDTLFFAGEGTVILVERGATPVIPVEWFGAKGNGVADDSDAINKAMLVAQPGIVKFSNKVYGVRSTIWKPTSARVHSEPGAVLQALDTGLTGVMFDDSLHRGVHTLPILRGFNVALHAAGMCNTVVPLIEDCNDAVFLHAHSENTPGGITDVVAANFEIGTIQNCRRGVVFKTDLAMAIMQGNEVRVGKFLDTKSKANALAYWQGPLIGAWDSTSLWFGTVDVPSASGFALLRGDASVADNGPGAVLLRQNLFIDRLEPMAAGARVADGYIGQCHLKIGVTAPLKKGQLDMPRINQNNIIITDLDKAVRNTKYLLRESQGTLASFNNGVPIHASTFTVRVPNRVDNWAKGTSRRYYFYHMLAQRQELYNLVQPTHGGMCMKNNVAVTALFDNSGNGGTSSTNWAPYEVMIQLTACDTIAATTEISIPLLAGSVGV